VPPGMLEQAAIRLISACLLGRDHTVHDILAELRDIAGDEVVGRLSTASA